MYRIYLFALLIAGVNLNASDLSGVDFPPIESEIFWDKDKDGIADHLDNCPHIYNPRQDDSDRDGIGDICDDDDCGCSNEYQTIYVCQDGMTRRVNCSALSDPYTYCGPCQDKTEPKCSTCEVDDRGNLTICRITGSNMHTFKGRCEDLTRFFNNDGSFANNKDQCGKCSCEMIGDKDSDGDGVCDRFDECPNNPLKYKAGMCGCYEYDSDSDWVCDKDDICPGGNDKLDEDNDGIPNYCDKCQGYDDRLDSDYDGIPDGCDLCPDSASGDSDGDGVCDDIDICAGGDDKIDDNNNGIPDDCEREKCAVSGNSDFEWIDDVKINDWFNPTGDNGGYAQFSDPSLMFFHGDTLKLWMSPGYLDNVAELSMAIFVDWNGDKDFDDQGERVYDARALKERGLNIIVPPYAMVGEICVRFILDYGRIINSCDPCIDGEVEDYTIRIKGESCNQTEENFDYDLDSPVQGLNGGWGWLGPWKANVTGSPKARILQNSLSASNSDTEGHKLGIYTPSGTNYMVLREFEISNDDLWMSFHYLRKGGKGTMNLMIGENDESVSIDENGNLMVGHIVGPSIATGSPSYIIVNIKQSQEGSSIRAWVNPSASALLNTENATTLANASLIGNIDHMIFTFDGTDYIAPTDHYIDEIRVGCSETTVNLQEQGGGVLDQIEQQLTIAPNPVGMGSNAGITLSNASFFQGVLNIYDITGALVVTQAAVAGLNVLPTSTLQPGMYILEIVTDNGSITEQLIIQS